MLYQELPPIESARLERWERWLAPSLAIGAGATLGVLLLLIGQSWMALAGAAGGLIAAALIYFRHPAPPARAETILIGPDYSLIGSALSLSRDPAALTTSEGSLLIVNAAYRERFGGKLPPLAIGSDDEARAGLEMA